MPLTRRLITAACLLTLVSVTANTQPSAGDTTNDRAVGETVRQIRVGGASPDIPVRRARGFATRHFDILGNYTTLSVPVAELGTVFDEVYEYVSARTGIDVDGLIPVTVQPAFTDPCPPRGRASSQGIELFADAGWSRGQLLGVLAHELGHVLQFREVPGIGRLGAQFPQGYASWAAGRYWADWQGHASLHAAVQDYIERDSFLPLSTPARFVFQDDIDSVDTTDCIAQRDIVLTEWASLIEYLVARYGHDSFYARAEAAPEPGADGVDYRAIFDRSFDQLESDWLEAVRAHR